MRTTRRHPAQVASASHGCAVCIATILVAFALPARAELAAPVVLSPDQPLVSIVSQLRWLKDPDHSLEVEDFLHGNAKSDLVAVPDEGLQFGYDDARYWVYLRLENPLSEPTSVIVEAGLAHLGSVDATVVAADGTRRTYHTGRLVPRHVRPLEVPGPAFPVSIAPRSTVEILIRAESDRSVVIPVTIASMRHFMAAESYDDFQYGAFIAAIFALALYTLFLYTATRESAYLWYVAISAGTIYYSLSNSGLGPLLVYSPPLWGSFGTLVGTVVSGVSFQMFARSYLGLSGWMSRVCLFFVGIGLLSVVAYLVGGPAPSRALLSVFIVAGTFAALVIAGIRAYQAATLAWFFLAGWGGFLIASTYANLAYGGIVPGAAFVGLTLRTGVVLERLASSMGLAYRLKVLQEEKATLHGIASVARAETAAAAEERRQAEHALKERDRQLRQAQKMEAIGKLAGGLAHDFNNLLQAILGFVEMLRSNPRLPDDAQEDLDEIKAAGTRAAELTRDLLAFSRQQVLQTYDVDLNEIIADMKRLLGRLLGEDVELSFRPSSEPAIVRGDSAQLSQVVMNLCVNARDAMPTGGRLDLSTRMVTYQLDDDEAPSPYVELSVRDTGEGIPPGALSRIFEPFFSTKPEGKGTGLGLATVYGIVRQHDGDIQASSKVGSGTTFRIYLPLSKESDSPRPPGRDLVAPPRPCTVLVAEDHPQVRSWITRVLEEHGFEVIQAEDGDSAMRIYRERQAEIELAVFDVVMPGMDTRELLERLRALSPELPIVFCSGYTTEAVSRRIVLDQHCRLIQKPLGSTQLLEAIQVVRPND